MMEESDLNDYIMETFVFSKRLQITQPEYDEFVNIGFNSCDPLTRKTIIIEDANIHFATYK